jgi:hypothetical protein
MADSDHVRSDGPPSRFNTYLMRMQSRPVPPGCPPAPPRDHPTWLRWLLLCELHDRFNDDADDRIYQVDLLLERVGLPDSLKPDVYAVLINAFGIQELRDTMRAAMNTDTREQVESFRQTLEAFHSACFYDWDWASTDLLEAADSLLDLLDRDRGTAPPEPSPEMVVRYGVTAGRGQPRKPEVRWALHELEALGIDNRDGRRELLSIVGVITEQRPRPDRA